ncbi:MULTISPECIES: DUF6036 family nucleotidyltransferase [Mycobacterium avium complex (MAC)]|uniref:DUF6036 family nucleotidyltransferase n=1 Tax=Mycobacterium intracellulare subsp. chimaera TaxID=222805 RepID=A0ABT7P3M4_MYCIT|nr:MULTISPECIES: DUF6036 family nucleotidyltransferase [Mycobacterium avium complex (MAC)]MDM3927849.1 DUF6036 family nucleotidyltransferase [Mycobacterium intracellulare subsp. chimaera]
MNADEIRQLLTALDKELQRKGKAATIFIVGGAAMALAYNADRATDDVDATFQPRDVVLDAAETVAAEAKTWGYRHHRTTTRPNTHYRGQTLTTAVSGQQLKPPRPRRGRPHEPMLARH